MSDWLVALFSTSLRMSPRLLLTAICADSSAARSSACCFALCPAVCRAPTKVVWTFPRFATSSEMLFTA